MGSPFFREIINHSFAPVWMWMAVWTPAVSMCIICMPPLRVMMPHWQSAIGALGRQFGVRLWNEKLLEQDAMLLHVCQNSCLVCYKDTYRKCGILLICNRSSTIGMLRQLRARRLSLLLASSTIPWSVILICLLVLSSTFSFRRLFRSVSSFGSLFP